MAKEISKEIKALILEKTKQTFVHITPRCNDAIYLALLDAKNKGKTTCLIFSEGGWPYYETCAKELGFEVKIIENKKNSIDLKTLEMSITKNTVLIHHTLSGYMVPMPVEEIFEITKKKNALFINDCSGSIANEHLLKGDYLVCSFGRWKPINYGKGGFIAHKKHLEVTIPEYDIEKWSEHELQELYEKITRLLTRTALLQKICQEISVELQNQGITLLKTPLPKEAIVIICEYETDAQKEIIVSLAKKQHIPFKPCPFMIRTNSKGISLEVKRLNI